MSGHVPKIDTDEYPNGRKVDSSSLDDLRSWGATVDYLISVGQLHEDKLTALDADALGAYRDVAGHPMSDPYGHFCPRCGQSRDDGLAFNRNACGHEWHGEGQLAGPGEDGPEPPECTCDTNPATTDGPSIECPVHGLGEDERPWSNAEEVHRRASGLPPEVSAALPSWATSIDPTYLAQETGTIAYRDEHGHEVTESDRMADESELREGDRLAEEMRRPPLEAVDADDDDMAQAIYHASLVEPYGAAVPRWEQLGDRGRDTYRAQARRVRELLGLVGAPGVEPQRVVVGFGSPAVATEVLETLRRWHESGDPIRPQNIEALIERMEGGE